MLDVLCLTKYDWANSVFRYVKCLKSLGLKVIFFKGESHHFSYPEQGMIHPAIGNAPPHTCLGQHPLIVKVPELKKLAEKAKVIHYFASNFIDTGADLSGKKVIGQHGGSMYRQDPDAVNAFFNPIVDATIIQCPDLLGLGAKNEHLVYYPVDTDYIIPDFRRKNKKLLIGHFPSYTESKGTNTILKVIRGLNGKVKDRFEYVGIETPMAQNLSWLEHLKRVNDCDILIETCNPIFMGKQFGAFGNAALEAAALGKIVVTNDLYQNIYKKEYGDCELVIANNGNELKNVLTKLLSLSDDEILEKKRKTREWAERNHSIPVTAKRLFDKIYGDLLNA